MKDFKSLVDVLNEYSFLFDPMYAGFAYETRCRAYMELGELQKALDDCTAALRIVSSPQAQRLQQGLIERLAKPEQKPTAALVPPPVRSDAQDQYPHLSSQVIDEIRTKIRKAGFEPNGVAVVYDLEDWHRQFPAKHPYAKMLDLQMPSIKEAVEVMAHFAQDGLAFAAKADRSPRFHVMLVDDRERKPDDRALDRHTWGTLGISIVQSHSVAELQKNMPKGAPDVILIAETLPESMKAEIRKQITNIPTVTMPIPVAPASSQPVMSGPMPRQTPEEMAYERALRGFEEALFDALEKINPADRPIYVSFVTM